MPLIRRFEFRTSPSHDTPDFSPHTCRSIWQFDGGSERLCVRQTLRRSSVPLLAVGCLLTNITSRFPSSLHLAPLPTTMPPAPAYKCGICKTVLPLQRCGKGKNKRKHFVVVRDDGPALTNRNGSQCDSPEKHLKVYLYPLSVSHGETPAAPQAPSHPSRPSGSSRTSLSSPFASTSVLSRPSSLEAQPVDAQLDVPPLSTTLPPPASPLPAPPSPLVPSSPLSLMEDVPNVTATQVADKLDILSAHLHEYT
ncbi:hypothetical protein FB45DRAFT_225382 [Roridomyces roridus]|uniref:Uncharacterized protein n=1 Tax=Roridomyces roridus TaxID=1738132 RepID=A0AAD7FDG4_9AGAR|nr:hypothetical protein FB45DRAFT_225382 [Roridomyces roridus]